MNYEYNCMYCYGSPCKCPDYIGHVPGWESTSTTDVKDDNKVKTYEIDFGGHCKCLINVNGDGKIEIINAINGYGGVINLEYVKISEVGG